MAIADTIRVFTTVYPDIEVNTKNDRHVEFFVTKDKLRDVIQFVKATYPEVLPESVFGVDIGDDNYQVNYMFWLRGTGIIIQLRVNLSSPELDIDSTCDIFPGFEWHERETHEMFGIRFINHPNLDLLLLPDELEGKYPLRKSFQTDRSRLEESGLPIRKPRPRPKQKPEEGGTEK